MVVEEDHGMHGMLRGDGSGCSSSGGRVEGVVGVDGWEGNTFQSFSGHAG